VSTATLEKPRKKLGRPRVSDPIRSQSVGTSDGMWSAWDAEARSRGISVSQLIRDTMEAALSKG
jgi:hypothetical protein